MVRILDIIQDKDNIKIDLDVNGAHVILNVQNDVTVLVHNAHLKIAELRDFRDWESIRMEISPVTHVIPG